MRTTLSLAAPGVAVVLLFLFLSGAPRAADEAVPQAALRVAVQKSLDLLVKTSPTFIQKGGCNSCHNQTLPSAAQSFARSRGITVGDTLAQLPAEVSEATTERYIEYSVGGGGGIGGLGFEFLAHSLARDPADARTRAQVHYIKSQQQPEGHWSGAGGNQPGARRPPLNTGDFTSTAFMVLALQNYGPPADAADTKARVEKARQWLTKTAAERTQEHAFKVLGLAWSGADRKTIDQAAHGLEALQRPDGSWSQLPTLEPDAYATGLALYALSVGGVAPANRVYQAGLKYLLSTQAADGTWHVKSRSMQFQPYLETGYPYGTDQWISAAGTSYAALAMAAATDTAPAR